MKLFPSFHFCALSIPLLNSLSVMFYFFHLVFWSGWLTQLHVDDRVPHVQTGWKFRTSRYNAYVINSLESKLTHRLTQVESSCFDLWAIIWAIFLKCFSLGFVHKFQQLFRAPMQEFGLFYLLKINPNCTSTPIVKYYIPLYLHRFVHYYLYFQLSFLCCIPIHN